MAFHPSVGLSVEANPGPAQNAALANEPWQSRPLQRGGSSAANPVTLLLLLHLLALGMTRVFRLCRVFFEEEKVVLAGPAAAVVAAVVAAVPVLLAAACRTASVAGAVGVRPPAAREWLCRLGSCRCVQRSGRRPAAGCDVWKHNLNSSCDVLMAEIGVSCAQHRCSRTLGLCSDAHAAYLQTTQDSEASAHTFLIIVHAQYIYTYMYDCVTSEQRHTTLEILEVQHAILVFD